MRVIALDEREVGPLVDGDGRTLGEGGGWGGNRWARRVTCHEAGPEVQSHDTEREMVRYGPDGDGEIALYLQCPKEHEAGELGIRDSQPSDHRGC